MGESEDIAYSKESTHYSLTNSDIIAHFADGTQETGSLLIGADGVRPAVGRKNLHHLRVLDTKSLPIFEKTPLTHSSKNYIPPKAREWLSFSKDPQTGSVTQMEVIRFLSKDWRKNKRHLPNDSVYLVLG